MALSGIKISELKEFGQGTEAVLTPGSDRIELVINIDDETYKSNLNRLQNLSKLNIATDLSIGGVGNIPVLNTTAGTITNLTNTVLNSQRGTFTTGLTGNLKGNVEGNVQGSLQGQATTATKLNTVRQFKITGDIVSDTITTDLNGNLTLTNTQLQGNTVSNSNVEAAAGILGTKIVPSFGAQNIIATGSLQLSGTASELPSVLINNEGNNTNRGSLVFRKSRGQNSIGPVQVGDTLGEIFFTGRDSSNTLRNSARIANVVTGVSTTSLSSDLVISTSLQALTERVRITEEGRIGINEPNPATTIDILGSGSNYTTPNLNNVPSIKIYNSASSAGNAHAFLSLQTLGTGGDPFISYAIGVDGWSTGVDNSDSDTFKISASWSDISTNTRLRIDQDGNTTISGNVTIPNAKSYAGLNSTGTTSAYFLPNWTDNITYLNYGSAGFNIRDSVSNSRMFFTNGGLVGVGCINPSENLEVGGYMRIRSLATNNNTYEGGGQLAIKSVNSSNDPYISFHSQSGARQGYLQFGNDFARIRCQVSGTVFLGSANSDDMVISAAGNVGIGDTTPSYQLQLSKNSAAKPTSNVWIVASDIRLKENIVLADTARCLDIVKELPLKRYTWKDNVYNNEQVPDRTKIGWIAQDVQQVFPKGVTQAPMTFSPTGLSADNITIEDCLSLDADQIYATLYGAVQEVIKRLEILEAKI